MRKHSPIIEWTIVENDTDWERGCALLQPDHAQADHQQLLGRYFWIVATFFLLLLVAGNGWRTPQDKEQPAAIAGMTLAQQDFSAAPPQPKEPTRVEQITDHQAVAEFQATLSWQSQWVEQTTGLQSIQTAHCDTPADPAFHTDDQTAAHVITYIETDAQGYRQTYFYRCTVKGWLRTTVAGN